MTPSITPRESVRIRRADRSRTNTDHRHGARQSTIGTTDANRPVGADFLKMQRRMIRVGPKKRVVLVGLFLNVSRQCIVTLPELRQGMRTEAHLLPGTRFSARTQAHFKRGDVACGDRAINFAVDPFNEMRTATAGSEVLLTPRSASLADRTNRPSFPFRFREMNNGVFDRFHGHTQNNNPIRSRQDPVASPDPRHSSSSSSNQSANRFRSGSER